MNAVDLNEEKWHKIHQNSPKLTKSFNIARTQLDKSSPVMSKSSTKLWKSSPKLWKGSPIMLKSSPKLLKSSPIMLKSSAQSPAVERI